MCCPILGITSRVGGGQVAFSDEMIKEKVISLGEMAAAELGCLERLGPGLWSMVGRESLRTGPKAA